MSKILFVENLSLSTDNPMSTCYPLKCKSISTDERFSIYDISKDIVDVNLYEIVIFGCRSLSIYKRYKGKQKRDIYTKNNILCQIKNKYFIIQDMHSKTYGNIERLCNFLNNNNINIIFTFYNNIEANTIKNKTPTLKHLYLPHHLNTDIFKDFQLEKKYDILLYGAIHPVHYPFRKRLFELLLKNKEEFNVMHIPVPSKFNPDVCEEGLAKLINMSKLCIATKSKYDYLVGKYFEIVMGKTLIVGDIPTDGMAIFKNKMVEINSQMTDNEILDKIRYALTHYSEYNENIQSLYNYVESNHNLISYVNKLHDIVTKNN